MTLWTAQELTDATQGALLAPFAPDGISIDTRTLRPGDMFVALRGDNSDGHAHIATALANGAAGAMVHEIPPGLPPDAPLLVVADTQRALVDLGRAGRSRFGGKVIAVTGSVGKTTTKEMLRLCLSAQGAAHAAEASHNNHWGVPLTLARLPPAAIACIVEIGMNHSGEIAPLARLANPDVAVITTIAAAHVGHLGSIEAIADEKAAICAGLTADGIAILPADSPMLPRLRSTAGPHPILTFGEAQTADIRLAELICHADRSDITAAIAGAPLRFTLGAPGRHMALNALAALAATKAAGHDVPKAAAALARFTAGAGRGATRSLTLAAGDVLLLDESYNASSASIRAALAVLALQPATRRIAILGDMLELGDYTETEHTGLADACTAQADLLYTCGPAMRLLFDAVPASRRGAHAQDAEALAALIAPALRPGDAILVKGSYGSRMRLVVQALERLARTSEAA